MYLVQKLVCLRPSSPSLHLLTVLSQGANASPVLKLLPGIIARRLDENFDILLRKSVYPPRSTCTPSGAPSATLALP